MENQSSASSRFAEQVNYQRALEGELARTIQSVAAVQTARVHLAIQSRRYSFATNKAIGVGTPQSLPRPGA